MIKLRNTLIPSQASMNIFSYLDITDFSTAHFINKQWLDFINRPGAWTCWAEGQIGNTKFHITKEFLIKYCFNVIRLNDPIENQKAIENRVDNFMKSIFLGVNGKFDCLIGNGKYKNIMIKPGTDDVFGEEKQCISIEIKTKHIFSDTRFNKTETASCLNSICVPDPLQNENPSPIAYGYPLMGIDAEITFPRSCSPKVIQTITTICKSRLNKLRWERFIYRIETAFKICGIFFLFSTLCAVIISLNILYNVCNFLFSSRNIDLIGRNIGK